ncbi:MAG: hypothetical protein ACD_58C00206G0004 [uncultured bacterium]|nr:MAG: hypothetical protein ACD_58C00206G0004 [uncultured bacterium]
MIPKINEGDFLKSINKAIAEGRHSNFLKMYLDNYEKYKNFFSESLIDKNPKYQVYTFKVTYLLKKPVWRIFEVCGCQNFDQFAEAIIDSMDWSYDHMHGFSFPDPKTKVRRFGISPFVIYAPGWEDDEHPTFESDEIKIENIDYKKYPKLGFIFDFGDGHEFDIEMINMRMLGKNEVVDEFPKMTDIRGVAPEQYPFCDDEFESEFEEIDKQEVDERKKEIEIELNNLLKKHKSDFDLEYIKDIILNEDDKDDLMKIVSIFDRGGDATEFENILELATDAWNYLPHKNLKGLSPAEVALPQGVKTK